MQQITAPQTAPARPPVPRGRWIWYLSGVATILVGTALIAWATVRAGNSDNGGGFAQSAMPARTVVANGEVSSLTVNSYGAPIEVYRGAVNQVTVTETIGFDKPGGGPPAVRATVDNGDLTLDAPSCENGGCSVGFAVIVPASFPAVTVSASSDGGPVSVSGVAAANIDSSSGTVTASDVQGLLTVTSEGGDITASGVGSASLDSGSGNVSASGIPGTLNITSAGGHIDVDGTGSATLDSGSGPVTASAVLGSLAVTSAGGTVNIAGARGVTVDSGSGDVVARSVDGPLSATTSGGNLQVDGLTGPLFADTGSGSFNASGVASGTARVTTNGGSAWMSFTTAPQSVQVTTSRGDAVLVLPGGPYAVSAESAGGPELVSVPVNPRAASTVVVSTSGGELQVKPPAAGS
jgi:Putative adhesin